ncbi:MAG TPA: endonuclease [Myxococcota bacterium]|nr:endonuclease [Myxococcota bacterium]HQK50016.1 endonuclease [Myxococcota bacterium]
MNTRRPSSSDTRWTIPEVYRRLRALRGDLHWWPGETPFEVAVGALLTQNTAWTHVERAIEALKAASLLSPEALASVPEPELAEVLRPVGYFRVKARRLKALVDFLIRCCDGDPRRLARWPVLEARQRLLEVHGVGRETADSILLYGAGLPIFVIDAYTRRIFGRLALLDPNRDYDVLRQAFEDALPRDVALWNDYHAQVVIHGKEVCRPRPRCGECVLASRCPGSPQTGSGR